MERIRWRRSGEWRKARMALAVAAVVALSILLACNGKPPVEEVKNPQTFDEIRGNQKPTDMPSLIKQHPEATEFGPGIARETVESMNEEDLRRLMQLIGKAVALLPEEEREQLIRLHRRFDEDGYNGLTENEIRKMQALNEKAANLLAAEDRAKLAELLAKQTTQVQIKGLAALLDHPDIAVRWKAVVELEKLGPEAGGAVDDIIPYLSNSDWRVRYYAAEILGTIGTGARPAAPALHRLLNDPDKKVRGRALWALGQVLASGPL